MEVMDVMHVRWLGLKTELFFNASIKIFPVAGRVSYKMTIFINKKKYEIAIYSVVGTCISFQSVSKLKFYRSIFHSRRNVQNMRAYELSSGFTL